MAGASKSSCYNGQTCSPAKGPRWVCLALLPSNSFQLNFWLPESRVEATDPESPASPPKEEAVRMGRWARQKGHPLS